MADKVEPRGDAVECDSQYMVRAIPNDDVYFYAKTIDNSHVVRQVDPGARRAAWKVIGTTLGGAMLLMTLLLPSLYGLLAGYQLEALRAEHQKLENERATLELKEAKLVSPERLEALAKMQQFIDPAPESVVYLPGKDAKLARR